MTIVEVAKIAGVSQATVSRVINQRDNVAPGTARAVREAMEKVGYHPPYPRPGLRAAKMTGKQNSLSAFVLILPEVKGGIYTSLQCGAEAAAAGIYHQLIVCNSHDDVYKQSDVILQLIQKHVAGVAIVPPTISATPPYQIRLLQDTGIPVVLLHRGVEGAQAPLIALPFEQVGYKAGRWILERGHRRVALFAPGPDPSVRLYEDGLRQALQESGLELPEWLIHYTTSYGLSAVSERAADIRNAVSRMQCLPSDQRPTAIFASYDLLAGEIYLALTGMGLSIPGDISLVAEGDQHPKGAIAKRLSCVTLDESHTGALAVDLISQMRSGTRPIDSDERFVMSLSLAERETLGPATSPG